MDDESGSDWDSMSEAPPPSKQYLGAVTHYPPPTAPPVRQPNPPTKAHQKTARTQQVPSTNHNPPTHHQSHVENTPNQHQNTPNQHQNTPNQHQNTPNQHQNIPNQHQNTTNQHQNTTNQHQPNHSSSPNTKQTTQSNTPNTKKQKNNHRQMANALAQEAALRRKLDQNTQNEVPSQQNGFSSVITDSPSSAPVPKKRSTRGSQDSGLSSQSAISKNYSQASLETVCTIKENIKSPLIKENGSKKHKAKENLSEVVQEKEDDMAGLVNPAYEHGEEEEGDVYSEEDGGTIKSLEGEAKDYPVPEECIRLLQFEQIKTRYFSINFEDGGVWADKLIPPIAYYFNKIVAEILGILKIPFVIGFVFLGQILRFVVSSLIRPFSDHLLKPLLVSLHNHLMSPVFSLLYNLSSLVAATLSPCCRLMDRCVIREDQGQGGQEKIV